jgi:hypothetical protein
MSNEVSARCEWGVGSGENRIATTATTTTPTVARKHIYRKTYMLAALAAHAGKGRVVRARVHDHGHALRRRAHPYVRVVHTHALEQRQRIRLFRVVGVGGTGAVIGAAHFVMIVVFARAEAAQGGGRRGYAARLPHAQLNKRQLLRLLLLL